ncbi:Histamine H2 receptor [Eumeta japonica]|uniref:Histamine H2 receptor n=1 Tax=Eumeta variegata TaxID=151549 RepID=A0A4C1S948_EUMVA|nr:Histamine H2 receptor [Eumeta japonica]
MGRPTKRVAHRSHPYCKPLSSSIAHHIRLRQLLDHNNVTGMCSSACWPSGFGSYWNSNTHFGDSTVVGEGDNVTTCHYQQMIVTGSVSAYVLFYMLVSAETYVRVTHLQRGYLPLTSMRVGLVSMMVISISMILAAVGTFLGMDYDFCERKHRGNIYYRIVTGSTFYLMPVLLTIFHLFAAAFAVRRRARESQYRRSQQYDQDSAHATHNIIVYMVFVAFWTPYAVIVYLYPDVDNKKFYAMVWIGVLRSVFSSTIYSFFNRSFRRAYAHLFNYCCCKSTLSSSFAGRHRRTLDYRPPVSDVRVHIMHKAMNVHSPQRAVATCSDTQEL